MTARVKALYDFSGEPNTSEISITTGEILVLTRTDVGEGINSRGETGLFPEAYVEIHKETQPPAMSPPVNPMLQQQSYQTSQPPPQTQAPRYDQTSDYDVQDECEDDWDDENDTYSEAGPPASNANNQTAHNYYEIIKKFKWFGKRG